MDFTAELGGMMNEAGQTVTVNGVSKRAVFDNAYIRADVGGPGMSSTQPALTLPTADVPSSPRGKSAVVGAVTYKIVDHEPDGTGVSVLFLEKAS